jgi:hypothetical protein
MSRAKCWLAIVCLLGQAPAAWAGMPAPLPTDFEQRLRLNESPLLRLQTISFFLLGFLLCAAAVRWLWNALQRDFPNLPRLSFGKALAVVSLWGLLFIIVLTMISGARELMTPGAWQKQGFVYKLSGDTPPAEPSPAVLRKQGLERLRTALWHFAATHSGRFPTTAEIGTMPADLWELPDTGGMRFLYLPGRSADHKTTLLVYEPELDPDRRLVLLTNGDIVTVRSADILAMLKEGDRP